MSSTVQFVTQSTTKVITIAHCRERKREKKRERELPVYHESSFHIYISYADWLWEVNDINLSGLVYFQGFSNVWGMGFAGTKMS